MLILFLFLLVPTKVFGAPTPTPTCSVNPAPETVDSIFTFTAENLKANESQTEAKYSLGMNTGCDRIDPTKTFLPLFGGSAVKLAERKIVQGNLTVKIFNITPDPNNPQISISLCRNQALVCYIPPITLKPTPSPVASNSCCIRNNDTYLWETNQCKSSVDGKIYDPNNTARKDLGCSLGDYCYKNECITPSLHYYHCPGKGQTCQESRDGAGVPLNLGNETSSSLTDCNSACQQTGSSLPSLNTTGAAAPTPTSPPSPGGAGQLCFLSDGKSVESDYEKNFAKNNPQLFGIQTAIGCVPTEPTQFILAVSRLATGMGGGIALLLMIVGAFKMITSAGNPDSVKAGSEQITSAIIGLLFIIFAVLLLKVIGVDILALPGFGSTQP